MKQTADLEKDAKRFRVEAEIEAGMRLLFHRHPQLFGFVIRDRAGLPANVSREKLEGELFVTEIGLYPKLGQSQYDEIYEEIAQAITRLVTDRPETKEVLTGRTFARSLH